MLLETYNISGKGFGVGRRWSASKAAVYLPPNSHLESISLFNIFGCQLGLLADFSVSVCLSAFLSHPFLFPPFPLGLLTQMKQGAMLCITLWKGPHDRELWVTQPAIS